MARMHTRKKGQSGSKRPYRTETAAWSNTNREEIEKAIVQLAGQGKSSSEIGMTLRDRYGVPDITLLTGKKLLTIMKEKNISPGLPEDIHNLMVKVVELKKHLNKNPNDVHNKRSFNNKVSKIRRLEKYYRNEGILPADWKYSFERAEMLMSK
ncbi:MAG: 30S ribosomal protein S15 [Candidatus Methanoperedens sp.]|nr:30S ribosomal protein S15 [Candidatus Methanoperedens sp.]MCE8425645.1 30S ribosomal protein S15 [Candidatus Methanoperedens sp.]MCE8428474.1 30S ribosomal protein S15 [Candidatus Methanoperedens sp.]